MAVSSSPAISSTPAINKKAVMEVERKRTKNPGVRVSGSRIYDSENGKTCHQCRQKTMDFCASCTSLKNEKQCTIKYCHKCLLNRYGENAEEVVKLADWTCPRCRGICNCSFCMKRRGHNPTGQLVQTAKATGFTCVSEMLQVKGPENVLDQKNGKESGASVKKSIAPSARQPGKENSLKGSDDAGLIVQNGTSVVSVEEKRKKKKRKGLEEINSTDTNGVADLENVKKKVKISQKVSKNEEEVDTAKTKTTVCSASTTNNDGTEAQVRVAVVSNKVQKPSVKLQHKEHIPDIKLPQGTSSVTVAGVELLPKDVGNALQLLEFCAAFGEVLGLRKAQAECVLKELMCQRRRTRHQVHYSSNIELHKQLLSFIQVPETGEEESSSSSSTDEEGNWLQALEECISNSQCKLEEFPSDCFSCRGYNKLDSSAKLRLLNFLCDEALCTTTLRDWIGDQNSKIAERCKEAKEKVAAARSKEKQLKQKMQDELAKAILARNGSPLSISEHEALVSDIKREATEVHAELMEAQGTIPEKLLISKAIRTEPTLTEKGHVFWKLNCYSGVPNLLLQETVNVETNSPNEKWFAYSGEQKLELEKYISCLRLKKKVEAQKLLTNPKIECTLAVSDEV